jgi:hypothetical protein
VASTCKGRQDVTEIIGNMLLVNSAFPHEKEFLEQLPAIWARHQKMFANPALGRKNLKNMGLSSLRRASTQRAGPE